MIYLGENAKGYEELIRIKTELATSIALCEEHDRRIGRNRLAGVSRLDAESAKLWLPSIAEYRRLEHEGKAATIGSDPGGGYLIQTQLGPFVDRLRPTSVVSPLVAGVS